MSAMAVATSSMHRAVATDMRPGWTMFVFFFNDTATTEIYTLSLHDALPISVSGTTAPTLMVWAADHAGQPARDRKSTRLNSSHSQISHAVFCLKIITGKQVLTVVPDVAKPGVGVVHLGRVPPDHAGLDADAA